MAYSPQHVKVYFDRINLPHEVRRKFMQPAGGIDSLDALTALLHHQLAEVPFENTVLHYTPDRLLTLTPKYVYNKVVGRGHGGMCFQVTRMFYEILVALGYDAFPTCARLNVNTSAAAVGKDPTKPSFGDWSHMITIVNIDGQKYLVDSNFGPNAPIYPVPLKDGHEFDDLDGRRGRIISDTLPRTKSKDFKYWHIQFRNSANEPWVTSYAFTEMEFLEGDYSAIERGIRANKRSWFLYKVMAFRFVLDEETKKPAGWILLWENQLRKRIHGKFQTRTVHSESERIDVLEEEFGIVLDDDEKKEILGTCGYLQPTPVAKPKQKGHGGGPVSQEKAKL